MQSKPVIPKPSTRPEDIIPPHFPSPNDLISTHSSTTNLLANTFSHESTLSSSSPSSLIHDKPEQLPQPQTPTQLYNPAAEDGSFAPPFKFPTKDELEEQARIDFKQYLPDTQSHILSLLQCDHQYCPNYNEFYLTTLHSVWKSIHPESEKQWDDCTNLYGETADECDGPFNFAKPILIETLHKSLALQRRISPDPLVDYDGQVYQSPFWFEGAGEIWRRHDHRAKRTTIGLCRKLRQEAEKCLLEQHDAGGTDTCYRQFQHSLICEPGYNCPYLRFPLLQCFRRVQGIHYDKFRACVKLVPNYASCKFNPVSQWSLHQNGKFIPDLSEFDNPSGQLEMTKFDENGHVLPPKGFYVPYD